MANGTPPAVPGWVTTLSQLVTTVGFPVVVACALLWFLLTRFQTQMEAVTARLETATTNTQQFLIVSREQMQELEAQTKTLEAINQHLADIAARVPQRRPPTEEK